MIVSVYGVGGMKRARYAATVRRDRMKEQS